MGILIDTSILIAVERDRGDLAKLAEPTGNDAAYMAAITASELLHGVHRANTAMRRARRERFVEKILEILPILPFDLSVARVHSRIWSDLKGAGISIGAHDLQIAATALAHGLALLTLNRKDFERIEDLELVHF